MKMDEFQEQAVSAEARAVLIKANVGSGKTAVLTEKIRRLHENYGVELPDMAVLTFTNKAADEILQRVHGADTLTSFGTFHSVAYHLLKRCLPVEKLGLTPDFTVITPDEELALAQQLIRENGLKVSYPNRLKKRLGKLEKEAGSTQAADPEGTAEGAGITGRTAGYYEKKSAKQDDLPLLWEKLQQSKKAAGRVNFSELIRYAVRLIWQTPDFSGFSWILVDEVQDCDSNQLAFIDALMNARTRSGEAPRLFAVGDPGQAIYSWRGSDLNVFYILKSRYQAEEFSLPNNYRSAQQILTAARKFQMNPDPVHSTRTDKGRVVIRSHYDPFQEAEYLAGQIARAHDDGCPWGQIAVFYRLQEESEVLEKVLTRSGIPIEVSRPKEGAELFNAQVTGETDRAEDPDRVHLMTLHASKGLEFSRVYIIGVNDGLLPLTQGHGDAGLEEMRLLFVGMTRARDYLELSCWVNPGMARVRGGKGRFLHMLSESAAFRPDENPAADQKAASADLHELKRMIEESRRKAGQTDHTEIAGQERNAAAEIAGQELRRIRHEHYGEGTVISEDDLMITICFDQYGEKQFVRALTPLERL